MEATLVICPVIFFFFSVTYRWKKGVQGRVRGAEEHGKIFKGKLNYWK